MALKSLNFFKSCVSYKQYTIKRWERIFTIWLSLFWNIINGYWIRLSTLICAMKGIKENPIWEISESIPAQGLALCIVSAPVSLHSSLQRAKQKVIAEWNSNWGWGRAPNKPLVLTIVPPWKRVGTGYLKVDNSNKDDLEFFSGAQDAPNLAQAESKAQ